MTRTIRLDDESKTVARQNHDRGEIRPWLPRLVRYLKYSRRFRIFFLSPPRSALFQLKRKTLRLRNKRPRPAKIDVFGGSKLSRQVQRSLSSGSRTRTKSRCRLALTLPESQSHFAFDRRHQRRRLLTDFSSHPDEPHTPDWMGRFPGRKLRISEVSARAPAAPVRQIATEVLRWRH